MEGRRVRRFGKWRSNQTLLPVRVNRLSNAVSCWYCDCKSSILNEPLFRFGRRYSRFLKAWFSMGVGFSLAVLSAVTMILLYEIIQILCLYYGNTQMSNVMSEYLFGFSSTISGLTISVADIGYLCMSSFISVSVHELGHALAAASEGIQMEYIAVFLAVLFPGALLAFDHELLQALSKVSALRIYCAGIWHNAVLCAVCAWALFLQPLILYPFYIHDEGPMVLEVSPTSPLSGHLSPGDVIISLDDFRINNAQEWSQIIAVLTERSYQNFQNHSLLENSMKRSIGKGYCIPYSLVEEGKRVSLKGNRTCPDELSAFITIPCSDQAMLVDDNLEVNHQRDGGVFHCFYAKDVLKLEKCGDGWGRLHSNRSSCLCSKEGACFLPLLSTGVAWVEITYSSPSPLQCSHLGRTRVIDDNNSRENPCVKTFVFVGDAISIKHSVLLTSYQPRWSAKFGAHLPYVLERLLMFTFHVSMTLALLNSLPVYFLDGEAISEVISHYFRILSPRRRRTILQYFLFGGTVASIIMFVRIFLVLL
ncbi:membrane-bound transcription factor site-2 protease homolog [Solanum verrucosum]|uniref:membrane-bound transcription factor site-2 protease homolog n=1 Tax=Solanum verrucosum TaxID=315347 RepID=UPI0020D01223|nr:membrane-bound transcription factor site-2 protease homolog [Solanum verrucosum]